ncbi:hypothetical protein HDU87_001175 [Geranomyces variabilis]|uniref:Uncharacterized protein n=1 Tax=Geranomyces variabilis TaxID=109894 RepID=A0AAD5XNI2_9FUNG|nr:hypothetical protein HDU87_001175 [Geranomyces variabilis]
MIRNLPSVRAVQFQLHPANDENAGSPAAHSHRTPVGNKKKNLNTPNALKAKTPATANKQLLLRHVTDKENTPMKSGLAAAGAVSTKKAVGSTRVPMGAKTPAVKAPPTALQGKSANVRRAPDSSVAEQHAKNRTVSIQKTPGKESAAPRAILGQKTKNTAPAAANGSPRYLPLKTPQNKVQKDRFVESTPQQQLLHTPDAKKVARPGGTGRLDDGGLLLLQEATAPGSSRKSSAKRNSARALQRQSAQVGQQMMAEAVIAPAAESDIAANAIEEEEEEEVEIEYMPPRSIPLKYVPPDDMAIDHSVLIRPGLDTYVSPAIRALANSFNVLPEFDPRDLVCAPVLCPDELFDADDIPLLKLDDDDWEALADCKYVYRPPPPAPPPVSETTTT